MAAQPTTWWLKLLIGLLSILLGFLQDDPPAPKPTADDTPGTAD